jgi:hypothetical protein
MTTAQQSTRKMMDNQARLRKCQDGLWKVAKKAPMFSVAKKGSTGREYTQYTRLVNTNAYKVAMSGACASVAGETQLDMEHLGMDYKADSKTRPWACTLAPGAGFELEQHLATIVQQIVAQSKVVRDGIKKHSRNHKECVKLAIDEVRESIFHAASGVPTATIVIPNSISKKTSPGDKGESKGDEEFDNSKGAEEAADEGAEDGAEDEEDEA